MHRLALHWQIAILTGDVAVKLIRPGLHGEPRVEGVVGDAVHAEGLGDVIFQQLENLVPENPFAASVGASFLASVGASFLASVGAAGIPHAGRVMMAIVLQAVGLPIESQGVILAVDRVLDMARTSVNVWSDACGAAVIDALEGD
jgi:Na+/H+-dicarboxylate symporter